MTAGISEQHESGLMRISIAIDNYNYRQFVGQGIESALAQPHDDVNAIDLPRSGRQVFGLGWDR
jgi:hypothetical protein